MKFVVAALAVLAVASPLANAWKVPATGSGALAKEFQDFADLIPVEQGVKIIRAYIAQDKQVQALLKIAGSPQTAAFIKEIEAVPEFKQLANYVQNAGLDIYLMLNHLNKALKLNPIKPLSTYATISGNGVNGLLTDLKAILPLSKLEALLSDKQKNSVVFQNLIKEIGSDKYKNLYQSIVTSKNIKSIFSASKTAGVSSEDFAFGYSVLLVAHVVRSRV